MNGLHFTKRVVVIYTIINSIFILENIPQKKVNKQTKNGEIAANSHIGCMRCVPN
jgi:hypothetical protein